MAERPYKIVWHNATPVSSRRYYTDGKARHLVTRHIVWKKSLLVIDGERVIVFRGPLIKSWYVGVNTGKIIKVIQGPFDDVAAAFAVAKLHATRI